MKILKFGGSSVGSPERIKSVIEIIRSKQEENIAGVVFSAYSGVTDNLIKSATLAVSRDKYYITLFEEIKQKHFDFASALISSSKDLNLLIEGLNLRLTELKEILDGIYLIKELTSKTLDYVQSFGELLSAYTITIAFKSSGIDADFLDARKVIKTDNNFGSSQILKTETYYYIKEEFARVHKLRVITGFISSTHDNETTTLGRGGSDYTASIIGAALNADEIEIWTDVDGVLTADPRKVSDSFIVNDLSYEEAMELSYFGAKVIYAPTIQPAMDFGIPVKIKNTFNPSHPGSVISKTPEKNKNDITGLASIDNISLIRIEGGGMVGVTGIAGRLFRTLAQNRINVILITQASSEHSICVAVEPKFAEAAVKTLSTEFDQELHQGKISTIEKEDNLSVVAVVGANMRFRSGVSGRVFKTIGNHKINVHAIAQGSSELNISFIIANSNLKEAMNALHNEFFFAGRKVWSIYVAGPGNVGSRFITFLKQKTNLNDRIELKGLINSRKMVIQDNLLVTDDPVGLLNSSEIRSDQEKFLKAIISDRNPFKIFVDCSASEKVVDFYVPLLKNGVNIVAANKIANASSLESFFNLRELALENKAKFLYETNVGAALPVIRTLKDLLATGDELLKIEGIMSGSVNYILTEVWNGKKFEVALKEAKEMGLTEPDPVIDLSGMDIARKLLILVRDAGLKYSWEDIAITPLAKRDEAGLVHYLNLDEMVEKAKTNGNKIKFIASFTDGELKVYPKETAPDDPLFGVDEVNNVFIFYTKRYNKYPLVVSGPGAGMDITASGLLDDVLKVIGS
jgi:aspartokinase/homoserine dehydrogenase 1